MIFDGFDNGPNLSGRCIEIDRDGHITHMTIMPGKRAS